MIFLFTLDNDGTGRSNFASYNANSLTMEKLTFKGCKSYIKNNGKCENKSAAEYIYEKSGLINKKYIVSHKDFLVKYTYGINGFSKIQLCFLDNRCIEINANSSNLIINNKILFKKITGLFGIVKIGSEFCLAVQKKNKEYHFVPLTNEMMLYKNDCYMEILKER